MKLSTKALQFLSDSQTLQGRIADLTGKSFATVRRWIENNDEMLTTASCLALIREETGLTDEEILTETEAVKK